MCIIANCTIIDQFSLRKEGYIYFLTHWHSDHYKGIYNGWSFGHIYTSSITRSLLLTKYPNLKETVKALSLQQWHNIPYEDHDFKVMLFDANHMAGSIMILVYIDGKYYFHTGDMRFTDKMARNYTSLFEPISAGEYACKYSIQQLHLDNTYCDPIFKFPTRSQALRMVINIVDQYKPKRLFICTDSVGKQEAFILLSKYYGVKVVISQERLEYILKMQVDVCKYFTLNREQSWIESIRKGDKDAKICQYPKSIAVTLTGWANLNDYYPVAYNSFIVPYSSHSNFREMEKLVHWIHPILLIPIVTQSQHKWNTFPDKIGSYESYLYSLTSIKQRGLTFLRKQYCRGYSEESIFQQNVLNQ